MPDRAMDKLKSVETVVRFEQTGALVEDTRGVSAVPMIGGPVGLIVLATSLTVSAYRLQTTDKPIESLSEAIADFNVGELLRTALENETRQVSWLSQSPPRLTADFSASYHSKALSDSRHDGVLFVSCAHRLTKEFKTLKLNCGATLVPKSKELMALQADIYGGSSSGSSSSQPENSIYAHAISFTSSIGTIPESPVAGEQIWGGNKAQLVRESLAEGAAVLARVVTHDLTHPVVLASGNSNPAKKREPYSLEVGGKRYSVVQWATGDSSVSAEN